MGIEPDALRVRNDLRRTTRDLHVATLLQANDLAFSRSDCRLQPPRKSRKCSDDNKIDCVGRGIQTHEPLYFNGLPGTAPNYKFNADKTTNRIATGNNRNNQGKSCPEVDQTSQYKRVYRYQSVGLTYGLPVFPPESVKASGEQLPRSGLERSRPAADATREVSRALVACWVR